jgi:hypothetical protein
MKILVDNFVFDRFVTDLKDFVKQRGSFYGKTKCLTITATTVLRRVSLFLNL